jgi:hypothetical protein
LKRLAGHATIDQEFNMGTDSQKEFQDFLLSVAKLRQHHAADSVGTALTEDAFNALCRYYNSDPVARPAQYVIQNILGQHPHLNHTETRVAEWGFEVVVSCDKCGQEEKHEVVSSAVDVATALLLGKHEGCKPKPRLEENQHFSHRVN